MSATLFITAIQVFLMGLVSEQISALHYKESNEHDWADQLTIPDETESFRKAGPLEADSREKKIASS